MTDHDPAPRKHFRIAIPWDNIVTCDRAQLDQLSAMLPDLPPDMAVQTMRGVDHREALIVTGSHPHGHPGAETFIATLLTLARPR